MPNMLWEKRDDIKPIVSELIEKFSEQLNHIKPSRIEYVAFSKKKSKKMAYVMSVKPVYSLLINADYFLCVHLERWVELTVSEKRVLILHELSHIPQNGFDESSKEYRRLIDHDVQDFAFIIKAFGVNWEESEKILKKKMIL